MVCRLESTGHCRKRVAMAPTVQSHVRMCTMLLCHFPLNRLKIQLGCVQVNLESYTIALQKCEEKETREKREQKEKNGKTIRTQ